MLTTPDPNRTLQTRRTAHTSGRRPEDAALAEARCPICTPARVDTFCRQLDALAFRLEALDALDQATASQLHQLIAIEDIHCFGHAHYLRAA